MSVDLGTAAVSVATTTVLGGLLLGGARWLIGAPFRRFEAAEKRIGAVEGRIVVVEKRTDMQDRSLELGQQAFLHEREQRAALERRIERLEEARR